MLSHADNNNSKDIVLLGMKDEILPIDFMYVNDEEIACIMDFVHGIAQQELVSRSVMSMAEWSLRARSVFINNDLSQVGHVIVLTKNEVNRLIGCGYITRKEIYDVYRSYGLQVPGWEPGYYYEKLNNRYKFIDDEVPSETDTHEM